eukprot:6205242-Pleurochrysis_carterae.AAC.1
MTAVLTFFAASRPIHADNPSSSHMRHLWDMLSNKQEDGDFARLPRCLSKMCPQWHAAYRQEKSALLHLYDRAKYMS